MSLTPILLSAFWNFMTVPLIKEKQSGFKYITLGADKNAEGFYEKLGYSIINEMRGQKIYQKVLI